MKILKSGSVSALFLVATAMAPLNALSSGGTGGGASGEGLGGARDSLVTDSQYEKGKKVFKEKLVCSNCPLSDLELTRENVAMILPELKRTGKVGEHLGFFERRSVKHYITHRFNL